MFWKDPNFDQPTLFQQISQRPPVLDTATRQKFFSIFLQALPLFVQPIPVINSDGDIGEKRRFFRCRRGFYDHVKELWAPDFVEKAGRANMLGESVLYVTDQDWLSCLLEIVERDNPSRIKKLTMIEYSQKKEFGVIHVGFVNRERWIEHWRDYITPKYFDIFCKISEFIDNEFRRFKDDGQDYLNSSIYSSLLLSNKNGAAGIRYKTVHKFDFHHSGFNYALNPNKARILLTPIRMTKFEYRWIENDPYKWYVIRSSKGQIQENGNVEYASFRDSDGAQTPF